MNVFSAVKQSVTTRQAADAYGIKVNRRGMAVCPFHNDKNPSMKVDNRFHCFGCQADGDVIDFVSALFNLRNVDAALKLAQDFGVDYDRQRTRAPTARPIKPKKSDEQIFRETRDYVYKVLTDYYHKILEWKVSYAPREPGEEWHPYFVEALQELEHVTYLIDTLLNGDIHDKAAVIADYCAKAVEIEKRMRQIDCNMAA